MVQPHINPPNQEVVQIADLLITPPYQAMRAQSHLATILGKNLAGQVRVYDLKQAPHMLIGGTAASGKSNFLDAIICSIIAHSSPEEVQLCLIDQDHQHDIWNQLPHLYEPAVPPKACGFIDYQLHLLDSVISEMTTRFAHFRKVGAQYSREVGTISQYHALQQELQGNSDTELACPLPALLVLIDGWWWWDKNLEKMMKLALSRIVPTAHAVGIHVLLAETYPEDIPDTITSYMPMRIAFQCARQSRKSLLDGEENLAGEGDMLVQLPGNTTFEHMQAPLVLEEEKVRLVNSWAKYS